MKQKGTLVREMGMGSATLVVVGTVIGSAVFLVPAEIARQVPSPAAALMVWLAAGLVSLLGGLTFAELAAAFPGSGGPYVYFREAFGPLAGYLYGWTIALIIQPGSIAAEAAGISQFAPYVVPLSAEATRLVASAVIVLFTALNLFDVKVGTRVLDLTTALKILTLLALGIVGLTLPAKLPLLTARPFGEVSVPAFGVAMIAAFWTYEGWSNLSYVAGEVKAPGRNLPLGFTLGIGMVLVLFLSLNAGFYRFLSPAQISAATFPGGEAVREMGGRAAFGFLLALVIFATLNCTNATILSGGRVAYAMAEGGDLPRWLAYVHPRFHVPTTALLAQMALTLVLLWSGSYEQLFTYVMCAAFVFYGLAPVALLWLRRKRPELERPYRVPLYPWLPILYFLFTAAFLANAAITKPRESLWGIGMVAAGIPVFFLWRRLGARD